MSFIFRMAWRDTRASRRRLLLFSLSIVLGVAALVAVGSLRDNLIRAIDEQTKGLLGADLVITSRAKLEPEAEAFLAGLGGEQSREISFNAMLQIPGDRGGTRLVQVRAIDGGFPFYGEFETEPAEARDAPRRAGAALLEETLLMQYGLKPGDRIRLGDAEFPVAGALRKVPGESLAVATLAPRVFIPFGAVGGTGLVRPGSLVRHRVYVKLPTGEDAEALVQGLRPRFRELRLGVDTVEERKQQLGAAMRGVSSFLSLVGFASLFLGAIGVASAIHAHVRSKIPTVAVLRCLGASGRTSFAIYLVQGLGVGLVGTLLGAALGVAIELLLPILVRDFLPFAIDFRVSWPAIGRGVGAGLLTSLLFAVLPLLAVRRVSPLTALRSAFDTEAAPKVDPWRVAVMLVIVGLVAGFAIWQTGRWQWGLGFAGVLFAGFGVLALVAGAVSWLARRFTPRRLPFAWRQGLANLHRPQNRTVLLLMALGLGTFLLVTLSLTRDTLLGQLRFGDARGRPNLLFFDIQDDQLEPLQGLLRREGADVMQTAPVVTMRISAIKGRAVTALLQDPQARVPAWTVRREYRSTYRGRLEETERVVAGKFTAEAPVGAERVPVSLERDLARELQVKLGDEIEFDVQGVPMKTVVGSLREVEWQRLQPNFFVVFPLGVLEPAPKFHIVATRVATPAESARVQRAAVQACPNVSAIDLALVLRTLDAVFTRASVVVEFISLFTIVTGVVVLAGAVLIGRHQRVRESVLLRTLGATKRQVNQVMLAEYLALGTLGAAVGTAMAVGGTWLLARFVFQTPMVAAPAVLLGGWAAVSLVTVVTGLASSRGICDHPPLAVLRQET